MINKFKNIKKYQPYIVIFVVVNFAYFMLNIGKNDKFKTLISFYGSLSIFISVYSLNLQINQSTLNRISSDTVYINKIFTDIDGDIYNFFSKNDKLSYYHNELYDKKTEYKNEDRNVPLEKLISFKILSNVETLINYIDALKTSNGMTKQLIIAENKLKKLLNMFLKSSIFIEHWKEYRNTIAMEWTIDYFDLYFEYY